MDYYELNEIPQDEYNILVKDNIQFSIEQIEILKKFFIKLGYVLTPIFGDGCHKGLLEVDDSVKTIIFRQSDEWYYLIRTFNEGIYKCDQWDGLVKCIEDLYGE